MNPRMTDVVLPPTFEQTASFTPGPWQIDEVKTSCGRCFRIGSAEQLAEQRYLGSRKLPSYACLYDDYGHGDNATKANASLIAAAPELLAALEYAHNHIMNPDNTDLSDLYRTIRVAIAAAKGGAQ